MATTEINIQDIGPIEHLRIPVPEIGGLVVLRGSNGSGKTTALNSIQAATGSKVKISRREGTLKGKLEGLGITLSVAQSTRARGELECATLEGRLSVAELVDPGIVSPDAADAKRIKALVQLSGVEADATLFYDLFGGQTNFDQIVRATKSDDLVALAAKIKRDCDEVARQEEGKAERAEIHATSARDIASWVDVTAEADERKLQDNLELAIQNKAGLDAAVENARRIAQAAAGARIELEHEADSYEGPTLSQATDRYETAIAQLNESRHAVAEAQKALAAAKSAHDLAEAAGEAAEDARHAAEQHERSMRAWREQIERAELETAPHPDELAEAAKALSDARAANNLGALVRNARAKAVEADERQATAKSHRTRAEQLRAAGHGVDDVLSNIVGQLGTPLLVKEGRLVLKTARGETYFADLSNGERWKLALDIAIDAVGPSGVLSIPQDAWQDLDQSNRRLIAEHVRGRGVVIVTAEATDGPLTAEVFEPSNGKH